MKRIFAVALLFVAGCGTGISGNSLLPEVTDRMRVACRNWIRDDAGIAGVVSAFEADRAAGFTKQQAVVSVNTVGFELFADDPLSRAAYFTCMMEIVRDVC